VLRVDVIDKSGRKDLGGKELFKNRCIGGGAASFIYKLAC
jgi:hypothetical protein